ncbi:MAG: hypothetical protein ACPGOY_07050 [Rhodospirillaceae bacterium]
MLTDLERHLIAGHLAMMSPGDARQEIANIVQLAATQRKSVEGKGTELGPPVPAKKAPNEPQQKPAKVSVTPPPAPYPTVIAPEKASDTTREAEIERAITAGLCKKYPPGLMVDLVERGVEVPEVSARKIGNVTAWKKATAARAGARGGSTAKAKAAKL